MPVRGTRSIYPPKGKPPTGIFSTKGRQKSDSTADFPNQASKRYAHSTVGGKPANGGKGNAASLRHQPPVKQW